MKRTSGNATGKDQICVTVSTLMDLLDCGRCTADNIGTAAGARLKIGRRVLYNVDKIRRYLDTVNE